MKRLFTLVELLAVIAIIAILASMTLGLIAYANKIAKEKKTTATMAKVEMALEAYKRDRGAYPNTAGASGLIWTNVFSQNDANAKLRWQDSQTSSPLVPGMVDQKAFQDGWKQEFYYCCPGSAAHGSNGYDLWSTGSDAVDASDDITSWTRK
jgi:type II secretion system protein G